MGDMKPRDMVLAPDGDSPLLWINRDTFLFLMEHPIRGKNIYVCDSDRNHLQVTVDIHRGVTPFLKKCPVPSCPGIGVSSMYNEWGLEPEWEWYRPSRDEYSGLQPSMKEHVMRGGLLIRKRNHDNYVG
jgi:hypothetical protein